MKIRYLGHSCFAITSDAGTKVITDPYTPVSGLTYGDIKESADIVTITHDHFDHNNAAAIKGNPEIVRKTVRIKGMEFRGIPCHHDDAGGKSRGNNTIFCFEIDGIRLCHLGDLGHRLSDKQLAEMGSVDVLFIPVGGYFTIDAKQATEVCSQIKPKIIIPMHFKTEKDFTVLTPVADFVRGKSNVRRPDSSEMELAKGQLPPTTEIVVLKSAL